MTPTSESELLEQLAAIEHERWADWQKWCHKVLRENNPSPEQGDILERWDRQIETSYAELSEKEKQSDRDQVMRYWPLIVAYQSTREAEVAREAELEGRIATIEACIVALSFEGIKLTSEQEASLRVYQRQLEAQQLKKDTER